MEWNHRVCELLCLLSFISHNAFESHHIAVCMSISFPFEKKFQILRTIISKEELHTERKKQMESLFTHWFTPQMVTVVGTGLV